MFLENKYKTWYFSIINSAIGQDRKKNCGTYYEKHHIVPQSTGGSNAKTNLILLTAREHLLCHHLLCYMICPINDKKNYFKMLKAYRMMCLGKTKYHVGRYPGRFYAKMKEEYARLMSEMNPQKDRIFTEEELERLRTLNIGRKHTDETKEKIREASTGRVFSPETLAKRSENLRGMKRTDEQNLHNSMRQRGKRTGNENPMFGQSHSEDARKKIGETSKGTVVVKDPNNPDAKYIRIPTDDPRYLSGELVHFRKKLP